MTTTHFLLGFILSVCALQGCADKIKRNSLVHAVPGVTDKTLYVQKDACDPPTQMRGTCFNSVQRAIDVAQLLPASASVTIYIAAGYYNERIVLTRNKIKVIGAGKNKTFLQYNLNAEQGKAFHRDGWGTPGSATFTVNAVDVTVSDLTIENTFDFISNDAKAKTDPSKAKASQAVALLLDEASDKVALLRVGVYGYQDTVFANGGRGYFYESDIAGNVDFIFGSGQLVIESSRIISRPRGKQFPPGDVSGYITAPSTDISNAFGLVFINSRLEREQGVADHSVTLGRPWHPTTNFPDGRYADPKAIGHALYFHCVMDTHIHPSKWSSMNGTAPDGSKTLVFTPEQSRFFEVNTQGKSANQDASQHTSQHSTQKTAAPYTLLDTATLRGLVLGDWVI